MKRSFWIWLLGMAFVNSLYSNIGENCNTNTFPAYEKEEIVARLGEISSIVRPKYTTAVEGYIKGYVVRNREKAERILGRALLYFPLFEKYLKKHNMPDDLKYLAIVESALAPQAISRSGAGGLWQFMPETGASYDLRITRQVDDRWDPEKSTEAAMKHLKKQYDRFGSWELALAAYNSGGGRVRRAVRRAGSKDFWRVQRFLPRETRNYVPAFIGATYLLQYYQYHDLKPKYPELDKQLTESVKVYQYLPFSTIQEITSLPFEVIQDLNPCFKRSYIPKNSNGYTLILPRRVMPAVQDYLAMEKPLEDFQEALYAAPVQISQQSKINSNKLYFKSIYVVAQGDSLEHLGEIFNCTPHSIMAWNQLGSKELHRGQELSIFFPNEILRYRPETKKAITSLPTKTIEPFEQPEIAEETFTAAKEEFLYYQLKRYESLLDVANKFPAVTLMEIMELNKISRKELPVAGAKLKIKRL